MKLGFWNVCGFQEPRKQREVSSFILKKIWIFSVYTAPLLEIFHKHNLTDWNRANNFHTFRNGRILFMWNVARLVVNILFNEPQVIQAKVECLISGNKFHLAMCYGKNQIHDSRDLRDSLIANTPIDEPLLICGDFNNILDHEERVGGRYPLEREIKEFFDTPVFLNLQDCPSTGCFSLGLSHYFLKD